MSSFPQRKLPRLRNYDYSSPGAYFITICTYNRKCIFDLEDYVGNDQCVVPSIGNRIVHKWINNLSTRFSNVKIDKYVVMPNHIHIIAVITEKRADVSIETAVQWLKTMIINEYISFVKSGELLAYDKKLWQKSYHDHIIRDKNDYEKIWEYIDNNILKWKLDRFYVPDEIR